MSENRRKKTEFVWDDVKLKAAEGMARGDNRQSLAETLNTTDRTLRRWAEHPDFQRKIDEIIQDIDIAQKSERIKIAKKVIRAKMKDEDPENWTKKDLLEWLKYVGEETGDYEPAKKLNISGEGVVIYIPENNRDKKKE